MPDVEHTGQVTTTDIGGAREHLVAKEGKDFTIVKIKGDHPAITVTVSAAPRVSKDLITQALIKKARKEYGFSDPADEPQQAGVFKKDGDKHTFVIKIVDPLA